MWSPDVYEGAPIPITAFLSVASKSAGFALFIRLFYAGFSAANDSVNWAFMLAVVSALTMTIGNLAALPQQNVKRLLAYSSISHGGYLLMGGVLLTSGAATEGVRAMLFYLTVYLFMNLGAFFVVILIAEKIGSETIDGYRGLVTRAPLVAVSMAIFLFSLTGIPPLAGFAGKWLLFAAVIQEEIYWLAIIGLLNSVISLYYYVRIVKAMFLDTADETGPVLFSGANLALLFFFVIPTILFGVYWKPYDLLSGITLDKIIG
jgi:NADH-quinone oxidoreductase subunit N